jgi:type II secretion system protein C
VKPSVQVDLVGTIYMGEGGNSLATLMEQGYSEADIYREGDTIVGNDQAVIARIERNRVILNNNGVKECIELASEAKKAGGSGFPEVAPSPGDTSGSPPPDAGPAPTGSGDCLLEEKYVQDELGPGFGTIIQKARLVPNTVDNQMNGFKIFAIDQGSLLGKAGLQNGDIITQVNDTSLKQPEQGFTLYQAFQDEREVRVHILRRGTTPMMITCRIK